MSVALASKYQILYSIVGTLGAYGNINRTNGFIISVNLLCYLNVNLKRNYARFAP